MQSVHGKIGQCIVWQSSAYGVIAVAAIVPARMFCNAFSVMKFLLLRFTCGWSALDGTAGLRERSVYANLPVAAFRMHMTKVNSARR